MRIVILILAAIMLTAAPFAAYSEEYGAVRLSLQEGDIQVYSQDDNEWAPASINMPLGTGDRISVPYGGRGELQIRGGVYLRLDSDTRLEIVSLSDKEAHFYIERGHIYINNRRGGIQTVQIDAPLATATIRDNSISLLDVEDNGDTDLSVIKGTAYLESRQGKIRVRSGTTLRVDDHGAELAPIASPDEWERWNAQRDRKIMVLAESVRYLPDELHDYANDLDENGRWLFIRDYGYVWTPVVVSVEWAPFRLGQWLWVRGDYTWIADERWGWAPYHYGRWVHISGTGWCWVPPAANAVAWGPGYVAWVRTSSTIGWVPLAPGETYYGRRPYSQGTIVISDRSHDIQPPPPRIYRNSRVYNGVTVVQFNSFSNRNRPHTIVSDSSILQQRSWTPTVPPAARRNEQRGEERRGQTAPPKTVIFPVVPAPTQSTNVGQTGPQTTPVRPARPAQPTVSSPTAATQPDSSVTPSPTRQYRSDRPQPRPFVRDSSQSVFRKEQPQLLPVKKLEEPKPVKRPQPERHKTEIKGTKPVPMPNIEQEKGHGVTKGKKEVN